MSQGAVFNDFFRLSGLVTELLAFCQDFNRCTFQARTVRSLDEIDFKSKTDLQIGADIYGPGEARDDLEQAEHVADTEASMQSRSSQCLARGSGALCRATLPVRPCHKSSFIHESAEIRLLCVEEGVNVHLLDVREAVSKCCSTL
ncbi:unnamed protein product [Durusdinium trenchii]|uniref:Uncharacterized protein n=1 Tax=Durusdinium trenchii TaxID=1381693 RepID=A0ABP0IIK1_9DINO